MIPNEANVVVIGGGVLGTSAAFHLSEAGHDKVVLLDRGPIASGTTPFAAGQTGYLTSDTSGFEFNLYCIEFFENFEERTGYPIDFHQNGSLRIALTQQYLPDLEARLGTAQEVGHDAVKMITPERAKELVPGLELPEVAGILLIPRDGFVEPKSVAVAYAAGARDRGVAIHTRTEVTGLDVANGKVKGVRTSQGDIRTEWVVLAAGAWTRQFAQQLGLDVKAVPVRHQAFVTAPMAEVSESQPIVRFTEPQIYIRPYDGGLLVGGYGYRPLSFDMNEFQHDFEIPALEADSIYFDQLLEATSPFFPMLHQAVIIQERRGLPTITPDGRFLVSDLDQMQGLILASGCMVGGVNHSPGVGRVVADFVSGNTAWPPAADLKADRFNVEFDNEIRLRSRCEELYANHYHRSF